MPTHKRIYIAHSHTKKIFRNMRRVGKGFSGRETPLFQTMMVQDQEEMGEKQRSRRSKRKDTEVPQPIGPTTNVADEAVNEEMDDSLERAATTATGLEVEQDSGNIDKTQSKATHNEPSSSGISSGSGLRRQETMGDTIAQTRSENVSKHSNDPLLARATEIASLKKSVKKLERRNKSRTHGLKRLYRVSSLRRVESSEDIGEEGASKQGRIVDIDANEDIYLVNVRTDEDMFGVNDLDGDEVIVESVDVKTDEETRSVVEEVTIVAIPVSAATTTTTTTAITGVEMTLAQALAELKSPKPKATTITTTPTLNNYCYNNYSCQGPGQGLDEELAFKIQAEEEKEERLAREKAQQIEEANITWDDVQAKINADYYNENSVNTFVDYRTELVEESSKKAKTEHEESSKKSEAEIAQKNSLKRAGEELEQKALKRQKLEGSQESEELKQCLEIILDDGDDVTIDTTPLSTKSPTIVDYKIYQERKKTYFQIIKADGKTQMYLTFGKMLKIFDREDLEVLWGIFKARFKKTGPVNYMNSLLLLNLKTMFEHHVEDNSIPFYLFVEKIYPLTNHTLHYMFNDVKLQVDYECEMAFELLRLLKKQLKEDYVPK
ncbi:hypothetical protein Tco_0683622 [Tanacetum coccineum]